MKNQVFRNQILISAKSPYVRMAILRDGELSDFFIDSLDKPSQVGAIYKARVQQKKLSAYFLSLGQNQSAFLSSPRPARRGQALLKSGLKPLGPADPPAPLDQANTGEKQKPLRKNSYLMAQVVKDSIKTKHTRASDKISLPGAYLVYMPLSSAYVGVSRQITDEGLREGLIQHVKGWQEPGGFIVRTRMGGKALLTKTYQKKALSQDREQLKKVWQDISKRFKKHKGPGLIYSPPSFSARLLRDFLTEDIQKVLVDDKALFLELKSFMAECMLKERHKLSFYQNQSLSLFDKYDLEPELKKLLQKKVYLPGGGFLILEETEAAVVVDVNSGQFRGKKSTADSLLQINLQAAKEIARQVRLRNCGGIILIDFIDMDRESHREKLMEVLAGELEKDRAPTNLFPLSEIGIAQITRKRDKPSLREQMTDPCPTCRGTGHIFK